MPGNTKLAKESILTKNRVSFNFQRCHNAKRSDTNCDPDEIDYVIPANDDAIRAVKLLTSKIADAVLEAKQGEEAAVAAE